MYILYILSKCGGLEQSSFICITCIMVSNINNTAIRGDSGLNVAGAHSEWRELLPEWLQKFQSGRVPVAEPSSANDVVLGYESPYAGFCRWAERLPKHMGKSLRGFVSGEWMLVHGGAAIPITAAPGGKWINRMDGIRSITRIKASRSNIIPPSGTTRTLRTTSFTSGSMRRCNPSSHAYQSA